MNVLAFVIAVATFGSVAGVICKDKPDGVYEYGCLSYTKCVNHQPVIVECPLGQVFDMIQKICSSPLTVPPPCGNFKDCSKMSNRKYPDVDNGCKSYFECYSGQFLGHTPCPGGLVFNEVLQACDYAYRVKPPCGTMSI